MVEGPVAHGWMRIFPQRRPPLSRALLVAASCLGAATLGRVAIDPLVAGVPFITYFPAVVVAGVLGGSVAGVVTLILGAAIAGYVWLPPDFAFALSTQSLVALAVFLLVGAMLVVLVHFLLALVELVREAQGRAELIAQEMHHRIANVLGVVQSISRLTARNAPDVETYQARFEARLSALGSAQSLARADPDLPTDLHRLLQEVLRPFDLGRIELSGPLAGAGQKDGSMLALLVHELATNAVKYGALSVADGRVALRWTLEAGAVRLDWREAGGPPVTAPSRSGFGSRLAQAAFAADGAVAIDYAPEGVRCTLQFPNLAPPRPASRRPAGRVGPAG